MTTSFSCPASENDRASGLPCRLRGEVSRLYSDSDGDAPSGVLYLYSKSSGCSTTDIKEPKLWCYDLLRFLIDTVPVRASTCSIEEEDLRVASENDEIIYEEPIEDLNIDILSVPSVNEPESSTSTSMSTPPLKKSVIMILLVN
ncbi:hypothetical protein FQR65_LT19216 [Abscondita terminalis]|nr:hypothetical protein FQR65_LT19216 [Abscondita terminalis]